jgi:hypothetical protein
VYQKSIGTALTLIDGLGMVEVVGEFTGKWIGPIYFRGSKLIDAIWATSDIQVVVACIMLVGYRIGDHHLLVVYFLSSSCLGYAPKIIVRPQGSQLNCKLTQLVANTTSAWREKNYHWLIERTGRVHILGLPGNKMKKQLDKIDAKSKQCMKNAEKKCQRIKSGILFSPESATWICCLQVYHSLLGFLQGRGCNRGNLRCAAYWASIPHPLSLSEADIVAQMKVCQDHCSYFRTHGKPYWKRLLKD